MGTQYEIERKYIVRMPDVPLPGTESVTDITQVYLLTDDGSSERVRTRGGKYTHNRKVPVTEIRNVETEEEISREEYEALLERRDPACAVIEKVRHVFEYEGQNFELDVFPFWKKQAMMEIELKNEDVPVNMPPFITVIREVTEDRRYKNHYMAKYIPAEE